MPKSLSIEHLASAVTDNGRRGEPKPGCDCVQCFGYCIIDHDLASRVAAQWGAGGKIARLTAVNAPVDQVMEATS